MSVTIAGVTASDRDDWQRLWDGYLSFYLTDLAPGQSDLTFSRIVGDSAIRGAIARDEAGRAVGLVHWLAHGNTWRAGDYCYLEDLFVAPDRRGGGIGRRLIEHVTTWAREAGCAKVYWLTAENNTTARVLYEAVAVRSGMIQYQIAW